MSEVEQRVLSALRSYLLAPEVVASAVEAYQAERKRIADDRRRSRHKLEAAAAEVERKIARLLTLVENGHADPIATGPRINELVAARKRLAVELSQQPASTPDPLGLEVEGSVAALMTDAPELEHSGISCCMPRNHRCRTR
jgi:site-specific DNA recombinase